MFLFVVVSRQTKKAVLSVLCVSAVKCPNPHLRKSACVGGYVLIGFAGGRYALGSELKAES